MFGNSSVIILRSVDYANSSYLIRVYRIECTGEEQYKRIAKYDR